MAASTVILDKLNHIYTHEWSETLRVSLSRRYHKLIEIYRKNFELSNVFMVTIKIPEIFSLLFRHLNLNGW